VRYESTGQPEVKIQQLNGAPRIRVEETVRGQGSRQMGSSGYTGQQTATSGLRQGGREEEAGGKGRLGQMSSEMAAGGAVQASQLEGRKIYSYGGDEVGTVEQVLIGRDGSPFIVMAHGGILGFLARRILLPASSLSMQGNRLLVRDLAVTDIEQIEPWDENMSLYKAAASDSRVLLGRG
jgi:hypothetical protein